MNSAICKIYDRLLVQKFVVVKHIRYTNGMHKILLTKPEWTVKEHVVVYLGRPDFNGQSYSKLVPIA